MITAFGGHIKCSFDWQFIIVLQIWYIYLKHPLNIYRTSVLAGTIDV